MSAATIQRQSRADKLKKLCMAALFCALAYVSTFLFHFKVGFLTFDIKDAIVTVAGLLFGPIYSLIISAVVSLLEFISMGETGFWGFLMDILSTATFSTACALIYKYKKNMSGALLGLAASIFTMTAVMLLFNLFVTPVYMGVTRTEVAAMIPTLLLPFNLVKAVFNAAIVMLLYKPTSRAMKAAGVLPSVASLTSNTADTNKKRSLLFSLLTASVSLIVIVICVVIVLVVLKGSIEAGA